MCNPPSPHSLQLLGAVLGLALSLPAQIPQSVPVGTPRIFRHQFDGGECLNSPRDARLDLPGGSGTIEFHAIWGGPRRPGSGLWCVTANGAWPDGNGPEAHYEPRYAIYLTDEALYFQTGRLVRRTSLPLDLEFTANFAHFAVVIDGDTRVLRAYVNGRPLPVLRDCPLGGHAAGTVRVGGLRTEGDPWDGKGEISVAGIDGRPEQLRVEEEVHPFVGTLADLRIWSRALDPRLLAPGELEPSPMAQRDQHDLERTIAFPTPAGDGSVTPPTYSELLLYSDFRGESRQHSLCNFSPPTGQWLNLQRSMPGMDSSLDAEFDTGHGNVLLPIVVRILPAPGNPQLWLVHQDADYVGYLHASNDPFRYSFKPVAPGEPELAGQLLPNGDLRLVPVSPQRNTRLFGGTSGHQLGEPAGRITLTRPTAKWLGKVVNASDPFWSNAVQRGLLISFKGYNLRKMPATKLWTDAQGRTGSTQFVFEEPREGDSRFDLNSGHVVPRSLAYIDIAESTGRESSQTSFSEKEHANLTGVKFGVHANVESFATADYSRDKEKKDSQRATASTETAVTTAYAVLRSHALAIDKTQARLDPRYAAAVRSLRGADAQAYREFVEDYGTHYAAAVTYGGLIQHEYELTKSDIARAVTTSTNVEEALAVGVSDQGVFGTAPNKAKAGVKEGHLKETDKKWRESVSNAKKVTTIIGSRLLSTDGNGSFVVDDPQPIFFDLRPQTELLSPSHFREAWVWQEVRPVLARVTDEYLRERVDQLDSQRMTIEESDTEFVARMIRIGRLRPRPEIITSGDPNRVKQQVALQDAWRAEVTALRATEPKGVPLPENPIASAYQNALVRVMRSTRPSGLPTLRPAPTDLSAPWLVASPDSVPPVADWKAQPPAFDSAWWTASARLPNTLDGSPYGIDLGWAKGGSVVYLRKRFQSLIRRPVDLVMRNTTPVLMADGRWGVPAPDAVVWFNGQRSTEFVCESGWNELLLAVRVDEGQVGLDVSLQTRDPYGEDLFGGLDAPNFDEVAEPLAPVQLLASRSDELDALGRPARLGATLQWKAARPRTREQRDARAFLIERRRASGVAEYFRAGQQSFDDASLGDGAATYRVAIAAADAAPGSLDAQAWSDPLEVAAVARAEPGSDPEPDPSDATPAGSALATGIGLNLLRVAPGTFAMSDSGNASMVRIRAGYWLAETEVSQKQWFEVMGTRPWRESASETGYALEDRDDGAASFMTWNDAVAFCEALTRMEEQAGRLPAGYRYRLPREAEWEMACRAGTTTAFSCDRSELGDHAVFDGNADQPLAVKSKRPNAWGFHSMHGNVWEFCLELSRRGGGFLDDGGMIRSDSRLRAGPSGRSWDIGLRPALARTLAVAEILRSDWVDDELPPGATASEWAWGYSPEPWSGTKVHFSRDQGETPASPRKRDVVFEHRYRDGRSRLLSADDILFAYAHLDEEHPPRALMLQFRAHVPGRAEDWEHCAYWGEDLIRSGSAGAGSRRGMGPLPETGRWVVLSVRASDLGLAGQCVDGMAFLHYDGWVAWDRAGVSAVPIEESAAPAAEPSALVIDPGSLRRGHRIDTGIGMPMLFIEPLAGSPMGLWLAEHEVTQRQWTAVMQDSPWQHTNLRDLATAGPEIPAYGISHAQAIAFCERLTRLETAAGRVPAGYGYRLPTPAEWEHGCRAGSTARYPFGDDFSEMGKYAVCYHADRSVRAAAPVRSRLPNAWGFYDMLGNVWERCDDGSCRGNSWLHDFIDKGPLAVLPNGFDDALSGLRPVLAPLR